MERGTSLWSDDFRQTLFSNLITSQLICIFVQIVFIIITLSEIEIGLAAAALSQKLYCGERKGIR